MRFRWARQHVRRRDPRQHPVHHPALIPHLGASAGSATTAPDGVILVPTAEGQDIGVHFKVDTGACNSMIARANVQQLIDANAVCREQRLEQPILLQSAFAAQPPTRGSASMPSSSTTEAYAGHCLWRF